MVSFTVISLEQNINYKGPIVVPYFIITNLGEIDHDVWDLIINKHVQELNFYININATNF